MKKVLFICINNSARSQMAEGLLKSLAGDKFEAISAGMKATFVQPLAIKSMKEIGIDISDYTSKSLDRYLNENFDYVITLCNSSDEICPFFPHAIKRLHWSFPDPALEPGTESEQLKAYNSVRDSIQLKIENELLVSDAST